MPATIRIASSLALAWLVTACAPWPEWEECPDSGCASTSSSTTGDAPTPTTGAGIQTVTGTIESSGSSGVGIDTETGGTTGDDPPETPAIVTFDLTPDPIKFNGLIAVQVTADHADGVRMELDSGEVIELAPAEPGQFGGEIAVLTGLINGSHTALLTPWLGAVNGATVEAPYQIALPTPGGQGYWETGDLIGQGRVAALGVLPTGEVIEFGTHYPNGKSRCYLRRRDMGGAWGPADLVPVLADIDCAAIDLQVDDLGAMFVLVNRQGDDGLRWWLGQIASWGKGAKNLGIGANEESAVALAHHTSGMVAVCGTVPTQAKDVDAIARIFRPNLSGVSSNSDYQPPNKLPHGFSERTRDCVFVGDDLVLVGDALGRHADDQDSRERLFILRLDTESSAAQWLVAPAGAKTQSGGQAVDVDGQGRIVLAGYTCDDDCKPEADLRIYDAGLDLVWQVSLGKFLSRQLCAQDLRWSPAGYAVVATGGLPGNESGFTVRGFTPSKVNAVWTFTHNDNQVLQLAEALAIGSFGEIYAGGMGSNGYPAMAYIDG